MSDPDDPKNGWSVSRTRMLLWFGAVALAGYLIFTGVSGLLTR